MKTHLVSQTPFQQSLKSTIHIAELNPLSSELALTNYSCLRSPKVSKQLLFLMVAIVGISLSNSNRSYLLHKKKHHHSNRVHRKQTYRQVPLHRLSSLKEHLSNLNKYKMQQIKLASNQTLLFLRILITWLSIWNKCNLSGITQIKRGTWEAQK